MDRSEEYTKMCNSRNDQPQRGVAFRYTFRLQNGQEVTEVYSLNQLEIISLPYARWHGMIIDAVLARDEWTGLKDNNDVDVFENDNIKFKYLNTWITAKVVISPGYGAHLDDERKTRLQYALSLQGVVVSD